MAMILLDPRHRIVIELSASGCLPLSDMERLLASAAEFEPVEPIADIFHVRLQTPFRPP